MYNMYILIVARRKNIYRNNKGINETFLEESDMNITEEKLSKSSKMLYGLGDFASQFVWTFTGSYLSVFYTDVVGLTPAIVSVIMLVARIWDAVNDPMFGAIAERTHTKFGRFRPYVLFGSPFLALFAVLTFTAPFSGGTPKVIWATVTYIGTGMLYTVVNLSYGSISSVMSYDAQDRMELNSWRFIGASVGGIILNMAAMPLIVFFSKGGSGLAGNSLGYTMTILIFGVLSVPMFFIVFKSSKEVVRPVAGDRKIPLKETVYTVSHNKPLLLLFLALTFYCAAMAVHSGMMLYYMTYNAQRIDMVAVVMTVPSVFMLISIYVTKNLVEKVGKRKLLIISLVGSAASAIGMWLIEPANITMLVILQAVFGTFSFAPPILMASIPECVDYGEDKHGVRTDGVAYSFVSLATKIGPALGPSVGLLIMAGCGYVPNAVQTTSALSGINFCVNGLTVILMLVTIVPVALYPLTPAKNTEIQGRLQSQLSVLDAKKELVQEN